MTYPFSPAGGKTGPRGAGLPGLTLGCSGLSHRGRRVESLNRGDASQNHPFARQDSSAASRSVRDGPGLAPHPGAQPGVAGRINQRVYGGPRTAGPCPACGVQAAVSQCPTGGHCPDRSQRLGTGQVVQGPRRWPGRTRRECRRRTRQQQKPRLSPRRSAERRQWRGEAAALQAARRARASAVARVRRTTTDGPFVGVRGGWGAWWRPHATPHSGWSLGLSFDLDRPPLIRTYVILVLPKCLLTWGSGDMSKLMRRRSVYNTTTGTARAPGRWRFDLLNT